MDNQAHEQIRYMITPYIRGKQNKREKNLQLKSIRLDSMAGACTGIAQRIT
jgi:hypothetical protein